MRPGGQKSQRGVTQLTEIEQSFRENAIAGAHSSPFEMFLRSARLFERVCKSAQKLPPDTE